MDIIIILSIVLVLFLFLSPSFRGDLNRYASDIPPQLNNFYQEMRDDIPGLFFDGDSPSQRPDQYGNLRGAGNPQPLLSGSNDTKTGNSGLNVSNLNNTGINTGTITKILNDPISMRTCDKMCGMPPKKYRYSTIEEDLLNTGLNYDHNTPDYLALGKGKCFGNQIPVPSCGSGIPLSMAPTLINKSRLKDLYNQHNFNCDCSPDTHIGKDRGYMDWQHPYPYSTS